MDLVDGTIYVLREGELSIAIPEQERCLIVSEENGGERWITGNIVEDIVRTPLLDPQLLEDFVDGATTRNLGTVEWDGHECHALESSWAPTEERGALTRTYWIGVEDHLPRRYEIRGSFAGKTSLTTAGITHLRVNVDIPDEAFEFTAPAGLPVEVFVPTPRPELLRVGEEAPDWTLRDPEGVEHSLADYRGKLVVLDFWGTWCGPCVRAMPGMQRVHDELAGEGVAVIGVSCREPEWADPAELMREEGHTYQLLLDGDSVAEDYHVSGYPTFYVVGKDGLILERKSGFYVGFERALIATLRRHL